MSNEERDVHRLYNMLMSSNPDEQDVENLFNDLTYIFDNPFDKAIEEAITQRKCAYIECTDQKPN